MSSPLTSIPAPPPPQISNPSPPIETRADKYFNLHPILAASLSECSYYKKLSDVNFYWEIKQRIIDEVQYVEAITKNRTPARAYCCLFKLLTMKPGLNEENLMDMITNKNGVVKGLGFLFIRIMIPSKRLWYWFKNSFHDAAPIPISPDESIPARRFVARLLRENRFQGQTLPTIPIPVHREYRKKLLLMELLEKNNRKYQRFLTVGTEVLAQYQEDTEFYLAVIDEFLEDSGNYMVSFSEYNETQEVALGQIKLTRELKRKLRQRRKRDKSPSSRDKKRRKQRHRSRRSSRSRDRSRSRSCSTSPSPNLEAMIREEDRRLQSVVYGQNPAQKIMGYKKSLSVTIVDSGSRPSHYGTQANEGGVRIPPISTAAIHEIRKRRKAKEKQKLSEAETVKAPSKDHLKKMQQLMAIYGDASAQKKS